MFGGFLQSVRDKSFNSKIIRPLLICSLALSLTKLGRYSVASCNLAVTQSKSTQMAWKRISPEPWFSFKLPEKQYEIISAADVNAKTYASDSLEVHFIYWQAANIPHFIRWAREQKNMRPTDTGWMLLESKKLRHGNWTAYITKAKKREHQEELPYLLSLWLPKVDVEETGKKSTGEFELTIRYQNPVEERTARRIIESLKIE